MIGFLPWRRIVHEVKSGSKPKKFSRFPNFLYQYRKIRV